MTREEFKRLLKRGVGDARLEFEEREGHGVLLCFFTLLAPLSAKIDGKWACVADFVHKKKAFVVKYYTNKENRDQIAKDLSYFEAILSTFKKGKS